MPVTHPGATQVVAVTQPDGYPKATYPITLGFIDDADSTVYDVDYRTIEDEGTLTVFVQGAGPGEAVIFELTYDQVDYTLLATVLADTNGDIAEHDLFFPESNFTGSHYLRATTATHGEATLEVQYVGGAGGTADPGEDAAPELVPDATGRWVLQDLAIGGLGSWVMPINPTSQSSPHVHKTPNARSTTAPRTGRFHITQALGVRQWSISGYCPNRAFHEKLTAYADLNRRFYVIDHRNRAWKVAAVSLDITPRKRQIEDGGTPQDWAGDYTLTFNLLDQVFVEGPR